MSDHDHDRDRDDRPDALVGGKPTSRGLDAVTLDLRSGVHAARDPLVRSRWSP